MPAHPELASAWREIHDRVRQRVGESQYEIWLAALAVERWDGAVLTLTAPDAIRAWVATRFGGVVSAAAKAVLGQSVTTVFAGAMPPPESGSPGASPTRSDPGGQPVSFNPRYSFEQFIVGDGNRLAHAAALAVAELPGQAYNPLFLAAPPGLGKTHLLHAIAHYVLAFGAGATVRYVTAETFTNHFLGALSSRTVEHFKRTYRSSDILLIDDVQFLASKAKTEEEFFHTFNALYDSGRQLVLTCDRLPRALLAVEDRLRERFEAGLVATIAPPDFATRLAILRKRAMLDGIHLHDPAVLELIAERVVDNVRALEGALVRIVASHSLTGQPIDLALARRVLDEIRPPVAAPVSISEIQTAVAAHFELTVDDLTSARRPARIAWPRQIAIHLARELTETPLEKIGEAFGGRNHATVLHASKRVCARVAAEEDAAAEVADIRRGLAATRADRGC